MPTTVVKKAGRAPYQTTSLRFSWVNCQASDTIALYFIYSPNIKKMPTAPLTKISNIKIIACQ